MTIGTLIASLHFDIISHKVGAKPNQSPNLQKQETLALSILRVTSSRKSQANQYAYRANESRLPISWVFSAYQRHCKDSCFFLFFAFFNGKDAIFRQKSRFFGKNPIKLDILQVRFALMSRLLKINNVCRSFSFSVTACIITK